MGNLLGCTWSAVTHVVSVDETTMAVTVEEVYFEVNGSVYFREKITEQYLAILLRHSSVNQYNKAWFCEILRDTFRHGCRCLRSSMDYLIFLITLQVCKFTSTSPTSLRKNFQLLQPLSSRPPKQRARQPISCDYSLITVEQVKYQLVYEERAVDPVSFKTYPFGYERLGNQEIKIVNMLVDLWKQLEKVFGRVTSRVRICPTCEIWCIWRIICRLLYFLLIYLSIYFTRRKNIISIIYDVFQARVDRPLSESWSV